MHIIKTTLMFMMMTIIISAADSTNFGDFIGQNGKTTAYSNQNDAYVSQKPHFITINGETLCSGMKWQCVEYARRWLIENQDIFFDDVEYATNIWSLTHGIHLSNQKQQLTVKQFPNGSALKKPDIGDLLIYNTSYAPITGHVSVIVEVGESTIKIAEQNYSNNKWTEPHYSQELDIITEKKNENDAISYRINNKHIIGWVRFLKPSTHILHNALVPVMTVVNDSLVNDEPHEK